MEKVIVRGDTVWVIAEDWVGAREVVMRVESGRWLLTSAMGDSLWEESEVFTSENEAWRALVGRLQAQLDRVKAQWMNILVPPLPVERVVECPCGRRTYWNPGTDAAPCPECNACGAPMTFQKLDSP